jgi:hypothetical protein
MMNHAMCVRPSAYYRVAFGVDLGHIKSYEVLIAAIESLSAASIYGWPGQDQITYNHEESVMLGFLQ